MAWYDNMLPPLRVMINDLDASNYTYTDEVLKQTLIAAAAQVRQDTGIGTQYTLDYQTSEISPTPELDIEYNTFVSIKAACLKLQWDVQARAVAAGVSARCGPVSMTTDSGSASVLTALLNDSFCGAYEEMKRQHNFGSAAEYRAILSPFSHTDYVAGGSHIIRNPQYS